MKPPIVIFALLVGAFAVSDVATLGYIRANHQLWPDLPGVILLGLVFGQQTFAAAWFTFARWNIAARLLIVLPVVLGLSLIATGATDGGKAVAPWFAIQLVTFCSLAVPMWIGKLLRWQIGLEGEASIASRLPSWQFSIWGILSGTTAVAIALGTARQVDMPTIDVSSAVAFFSLVALLGLLVFVVSMGIRIPVVAAMITLPVVVLISPLVGMVIGATGLPPEVYPAQWAVFGFCYSGTIAFAALVLRIASFRLWRGPMPAVEDAAGDRSLGQRAKIKQDAEATGIPVVELSTKEEVSSQSDTSPPPWLAIHPRPDDS